VLRVAYTTFWGSLFAIGVLCEAILVFVGETFGFTLIVARYAALGIKVLPFLDSRYSLTSLS